MTDELFDLSGRVAVVSGASRGIGEAVARALAARGATIVVSGRAVERCEPVVESILAAGGRAEAIACHAGDLAQIRALMAQVRERHGRLDILINNGATNPYYGPVIDTPPEAFDKTVEVNLKGCFYLCAEGAKLMRDNGGGAIVNTASVNAIQPGNLQGIYSITKAAVVNMTKAFAQECAPYNIRCNAVLPGLTETKLAQGLIHNAELHERIKARIPLGRHAQPDEMTGAILLLVTDAGSYITGESIVVDGGLTIASAL